MFAFEPILKYPAVLLTGFITALLLTRAWGPRAARWGFLDRPGGRKQHGGPTVTAGGVAVFLGFHAACALVFLYPWRPFSGQVSIDWWRRFALLSGAVVLLGLADDRKSLPPRGKLSGQFLIGLAAFALGIRFQNVLGRPIPLWLDGVLTVGWFLVWMNAFNLIDGIDGLAAGIALIASVGLAVSLHFRKSPGDVLLLLGFMGACGGFLRYNFYPARVFLGDTGSLFLGFTLAMLAIDTHSKGPFVVVVGMPLVAIGVPLFDTLLAIWRRAVRGLAAGRQAEGGVLGFVQRGDHEHVHHRLLRPGREPHHVALLLYGGTAVLTLLALAASLWHDRATGILALGFMAGAYVIVRHLAWIELRETGEAMLAGIARPVRRNLAMLFYVAADVTALTVVLVFVEGVLTVALTGALPAWRHLWVRRAPLDVAMPFIMLVCFRSYSRVWYLARISEYVSTGLAVFFGYAVALALRLVGPGTVSMSELLLRYWLMAGLAAPWVVGVRAARRVLLDGMHWLPRSGSDPRAMGPTALICGAGWRTTLFLRLIADASGKPDAPLIVGCIAPDEALRGHRVHGIRVLGTLDDLRAILRDHPVDAVWVTEPLAEAQWSHLETVANETSIKLIDWRVSETVRQAPPTPDLPS